MAQLLRSLLLVAFALSAATPVPGEEPRPATFEVHDFGFWIADPGLAEMNAFVEFPNDLPVAIESPYRGREAGPRGRKISPLSFMVLHGTPYKPIDITLEIDKGRFAAHWPSAEQKSTRLRWLDLQAVPTTTEGLVPTPEKHWFGSLRKLTDLFVQKGSRPEAAILYDAEVTIGGKFPLKLSGKGQELELAYSGSFPILDVLVLTYAPSGRQLAWIDKIEPLGADATKEEAEKPDGKQETKPDEAKAAEATAKAAELLANVANAAAKLTGTNDTQSADDKPALPVETSETKEAATRVKISLGPVLQGGDLVNQVAQELSKRLQAAGLTEDEAKFIFERYGNAMMSCEETIVLYRVPADVLEKRLRLTIDPEPKKLARVAVVLNLGVDPQRQLDIEGLIAQLGSKQFREREKAESKLQASGQAALEHLKKETKNSDPEIAFRVKRLLQTLHQDVKDD
jgi:hypothetical protein